MKRVDEDIKDFYEKVMGDMRLDFNDLMKENIDKMMEYVFNASDLSGFAQMFEGFDISNFAEMLGGMKHRHTELDPYVVLGINKDCSDNEVKQRYKEMMAFIHPDRTHGTTSSIAAIVNVAYEKIKKQRGFA